MKTFLELIEEREKTSKPVVMSFGRMNPPTTGHLKLIDKVKSEAQKRGADHTVIVSHSHDSKKNPLSQEEKLKHLKRYSPDTNFEGSSKEHPSIFHHAERLNKKGHDHLIVVAGSDRVKEYHDDLQKYNGKPNKEGHVPYHFKKIEVVSAGHRDPDAEGSEGMSGTKMREHAKNKNFKEFRKGVPSHVSDEHAHELMHDVRKGMGLHESLDHGLFKAIFITGGPGSGKDIIVKECIAESKSVEVTTTQIMNYLSDKQKLSEKSNDIRKEALRNKFPLIINGPADNSDNILYIKEELEELGYQTIMVFVDTTDETSKDRNLRLNRVIEESIRKDKWLKSQQNFELYYEKFNNFIYFDNTDSYEDVEEQITESYEMINEFFDLPITNENSYTWLQVKGKLHLIKEQRYVKKDSKSIQDKTAKAYNKSFVQARGPSDITPDNSRGQVPFGQDEIKGDTYPRKNTFDIKKNSITGGAWYKAYSEETKIEEDGPTLKINPQPKVPNFEKDNNIDKIKKKGDTSLRLQRLGRPAGVGPEYNSRAGGEGAAAGAGLGNQTYSEQFTIGKKINSKSVGPDASNNDVIDFQAMNKSVEPNPLAGPQSNTFLKKSNKINTKKSTTEGTNKTFNNLFNELYGFQNSTESGLAGTLGGADNKEKMDSYKDPLRNIINDYVSKKKKRKS